MFGVPVAYEVGVRHIVIIIKGALPDMVAEVLVDEARQSAEAQFDIRCEIDGP